MATEATAAAAESGVGQLSERQVGVVRLDGERHALVWIRDAKRTVNVLIDCPSEGAGKVRLLARLFPEESTAAIEALIADYRRRHVDVPRAERIPPRAIEPEDLLASPARAGGDRGV